jgi:hypothetical protein
MKAKHIPNAKNAKRDLPKTAKQSILREEMEEA